MENFRCEVDDGRLKVRVLRGESTTATELISTRLNHHKSSIDLHSLLVDLVRSIEESMKAPEKLLPSIRGRDL